MDAVKTGTLIRMLRQEKSLSQKALAEALHVNPRTVSKWETGAGFPDISLLNNLSSLLGISANELLRGELKGSAPIGGNMKHTNYYICPICGSLSMSTGTITLSCCGRTLDAQTAKKAKDSQKLHTEVIEDEWFVTSDHPMTKECYISFVAFVTGDKLHLTKTYPEWDLQVRIPQRGHGMLLWHSTRDGLMYQLL